MEKFEKNYMTEEDVKKALNITDFRSITKEKLMEFVSIMPKVDKEVAIAIINQFSNYTDMSQCMVGGLISLCAEAFKYASEGKKEVMNAYMLILEELKEELKNGELTVEEKDKITNKMIDVAEKIDMVNDKHKNWLKDILKGVGNVTLGIAIIGAAILGVSNNKKNS